MNFIQKIRERRRKKSFKKVFREYGFEVDTFPIEGFGQVEFAHWLHPSNHRKSFSRSQVDFYRNFVKEGAMAIDVGAYTGDTALPMALAVGGKGLVLALEPNPHTFKILEQTAALNPGLTNIIPLNFAATDEDGEFSFNYSDASFCNGGFLSQIRKKRHGHKYELKVKGRNLTAFLNSNYAEQLEKLALVKIDAEGYDREIIKSISGLLTRYRPAVIVECYKRLGKEERESLFDILDGLGYDLYKFDDHNYEKSDTKIEKARMMDEKHFDILALSRS